MQSPGDLSDDNIDTHSRPTLKRKLNDKQKKAANSKETRQEPSAPISASLNTSKRLKTSHSAGNLGRCSDMSKTLGIGARPKTIDLTRPPSNFQPHAGAKRLVIKNLKTTSTKSVDEYYDRTWSELDAALTSVFNKVPPTTPLGVLCRGVEAICRRGQAEKLFSHLKDRCKGYLEKQLLPELEKQSGTSNVDALRAVQRFWTVWNEQSVWRFHVHVNRKLMRSI
jgi:cullin-4